MKNYFKKFSIMFVVALCLFFVGIENSVFASTVTWNPNDKGSGVTLSNNNLTTTFNGGWNISNIRSNISVSSGKWYCELKVDPHSSDTLMFGVANEKFDVNNDYYNSIDQLSYYSNGGEVYPSISPCGSQYGAGDLIGMAIDIDNKKIKFSKNGVWYNDINLPTWNKYYIHLGTGSGSVNNISTINFGGTTFAYNPPTGYLPLSNKVDSTIALDKSIDNLKIGQEDNIIAKTIPEGGVVTWKSSDTSIATVDQTGKIIAIKEGQAIITATTTDGSNLSASCTVNVTNPITPTITLNKSNDNLQVGQTDNLVATTTPAGATVTWTSSDSNVATVDSTGKVTGLKEGQATITATTDDGLTATCVVIVTPKTTEPTNPDPSDSEKIVNIAHAKGDNTNNAGGDVTIIFHGAADATLSVVKTADVKDVWVGDNFAYTIVVTNTGTKTAKAVVVNDPAPNHIDFVVNGITTTQGTVDSSSTSKNIIVNVGDILPGGTVTIKIPATVVM